MTNTAFVFPPGPVAEDLSGPGAFRVTSGFNMLGAEPSISDSDSQASPISNQDSEDQYNGLSTVLRIRNIALPDGHDKIPQPNETRGTFTTPIEPVACDDKKERPTNMAFTYPIILACVLTLGLIAYIIYQQIQPQDFSVMKISISMAAVVFSLPYLLGSMQYFATGVCHLFQSVRPCGENSKYYSGIPTKRDYEKPLPPVLIQIPVYLESLEEVIVPTIQSAEAALNHYRQAGGHAKIFVNDDGLQVMLAKGMISEFQARMKFYSDWKSVLCVVARPPENRRGHFKKGSNMNFCLKVAQGVTALVRERGLSPQQARHTLSKEFPESMAFIAGGDLTMAPNTVILIIDSDTRLNPECITLAMPEFMTEPKLGYGQCITTAFADQRDDYFQRMIWDFTYRIYHVAIKPDVSRGHIAPLVGHNAFLSWAAIDACKEENEHGVWWWSESHVSEDFDMAMRMMSKGFIGRYITYTDGFEEGISLTFPEEEKKVVKFAYGAAEMLFNPFKLWLRSGPFSGLFRRFFMTKGINFWSKLKMFLYLMEYFGIALAPVFATAEGIAVVTGGPGYWAKSLQLVRAWDVTLYGILVFGIVSPMGAVAFTMRAKLKPASSLFNEIWLNWKYALPTMIQWTSYSYKFSQAILRYLFSLPMMSWGSTSKEQDDNVFSDNEFWDVIIPIYSSQIMIGSIFYAMWASFTWLQGIPVPEGFGVYAVSFSYMTAPFVLNPSLIRLRY